MTTPTTYPCGRTPRIGFTEATSLLPFGDTLTTEHLPNEPGEGNVEVVWRRDVLLVNLIAALDAFDAGREDCGIWKNAPELAAIGYPLHFRFVSEGPAHFVMTDPDAERTEEKECSQ